MSYSIELLQSKRHEHLSYIEVLKKSMMLGVYNTEDDMELAKRTIENYVEIVEDMDRSILILKG